MAHPIDETVGAKVCELRQLNGFSQAALAEKLGISFQQVQKYEKGANRISASKLYEISQVLDVPVEVFFEDARRQDEDSHGVDRRALRLAAKFSRIRNPEVKDCLYQLISSAAA
ncbi:helix-turn-helix domain-containing protein [Rhodovibrionaceae bacterium A322]